MGILFTSSKGHNLKSRETRVMVLVFCVSSFVCVEVLQPSQLNGVLLSAVSLPNHTFTGQA